MFRDDLMKVLKKDLISAHMPGHKYKRIHGGNLLKMDTTEIEGTDNLHHPTGIIKKAMDHARDAYGSDATHFLVGGSTVGILAAIMGSTKRGEQILVGRDCHQSVYHACMLKGLTYETVGPIWSSSGTIEGYEEQAILDCLAKNESIKVVVITSPSYYGYTTDLGSVVELMDKREGIVIVDEAHGAHLNFSSKSRVSALNMGAHIVVQSTHKTLPAMTQTGVIHFKNAHRCYSGVTEYLKILQSSSPSYVLIASIDEAIHYMVDNRQRQDNLFGHIVELKATRLKRWLSGVKEQDDPFKIWLHTAPVGYTGYEINQLLISHGIYCELSNHSGVLLYLSIMNTEAELEAIADVLDGVVMKTPLAPIRVMYPAPIRLYDKDQLDRLCEEVVNLDDAAGKVAAQRIVPYPPGIPLIMPGELITEEHVTIIRGLMGDHHEIIGMEMERENIRVVSR
ncbi:MULTISPECIES: aminotransferase class I/II-fold pyridoxal phosphate-dependent enzyme [unclassified Fusibacter]|uniref:aminotransferase class I/II-fold pyridoxal phosphate-dependent enzyme n=1 Tax=unclassified Fusibacter TaxID=2624464 RepID=UPI0010113A1F|nr:MULTISPECIES: aminotransferase class I/II-fold pyridoxal phosphate-dependent enzyme [unclassified Fusibacter]NPE21322.1 aminotransferase class I/II-fold pyridoxal phosphate-dependent enzyme [Fusibacter sp. A1]RXV62585.1 aminotransferase class I/II-fold pyridoxal phosphate-dependent enzyme [Fusibacter sp. A1]